MSTARFKVVFAGPLVSYQDAGRRGHMRYGVAASGPMDRFAHAAANTLILEPRSSTCIEVSLGGLVLECLEGEVTVALAGGSFAFECGGTKSERWCARTVSRGDKVSVRAGAWGSWSYLAFAGELKTRRWLEHSATHSIAGLGGGSLSPGDEFEVSEPVVRDGRVGEVEGPDFAIPGRHTRIVVGPQDHHFQPDALEHLRSEPFRVTEAFDRMGMRLDGPVLQLTDALSIPSEPVIRGSIQVSGDGVPTILLADHQTTGGYPKIATVVSCEIDRLTQQRSGGLLAFQSISPDEAIALTRAHHEQIEFYLEALAAPRTSLEERLMSLNLISGAVSE
jgi:biotin-dependent carboxylase-like uncharacterized protein